MVRRKRGDVRLPALDRDMHLPGRVHELKRGPDKRLHEPLVPCNSGCHTAVVPPVAEQQPRAFAFACSVRPAQAPATARSGCRLGVSRLDASAAVKGGFAFRPQADPS